MAGEIKFGTDGWRGVISESFTFENVRRVAQAIADYYIRQTGKPTNRQITIAVGYDTRFLSDKYAQVVSEVLARNGINVLLSDRTIPTPALSFVVRSRRLTAGVMLTASHNPAEYNGIKIKTSSGGAAGVEVTRQIEKLLRWPSAHRFISPSAKIERVDFIKEYVAFLRHYISLKRLKNASFKVLVDVMYGSGNGLLAQVLAGTKINLEFIRNEINPSFGGLRPEPVLENLEPAVARMKEGRFDLALVLDGDADRIAAFAGRGEFISPQKILGLLALHLIEDRKMSGGIVKTIVGTNLIDNLAAGLGLKLYETRVGFKYISELMQRHDILVGGEEAGGMGFKDYIPERDGSLAGLLLLEMMCDRKKPILEILGEMEKKFGRYYYLREDIKAESKKWRAQNLKKLKQIKNILGKRVVKVKDYDGIKLICEDANWLMFRPSGTEPIIRIYAEAKTLPAAKELLAFGRQRIKDVIHSA